jgi:hypothetical protein
MTWLWGWVLFAWQFEVNLYKSLFRFLTRRPDVPEGATAVSYVGAISVLLWAFVIGSAAELVALHVILPWETVRLAADILGIWGLMWMLGFTASHYVYPHVISTAGLRLRSGHHVAVDVPWEAVAGAGTRERSVDGNRSLIHQDGVLLVPMGSRTNVEVRLARPLEVVVRGETVEVAEVRFFADEPRPAWRRITRELESRRTT